MALLKEDGSLNIEWINQQPIHDWMTIMSELSEERFKEYWSKNPINEIEKHREVYILDCTIEEDIKRHGLFYASDVMNNIWKTLGIECENK